MANALERRLGIGLFGGNGHQIHQQLVAHPHAQLMGIASLGRDKLPAELREDATVVEYESLVDLLSDHRIDLVSLCSPRRAEQAEQAIQCLEAGKHVYAEKPCVMEEGDLDRVLAAADRNGREFHEMNGTGFEQPYVAMNEIVRRGDIGEVVQVLVQKSYPLHRDRPQDEDVDGGLLLQVGIHAVRMVEHVAGVRVADLWASETQLGNPSAGGLRIACSLQMRLENGGIASAIANYLNPRGTGVWGNDMLRIFGTKGLVESTAGGIRWVQQDRSIAISSDAIVPTYHDRIFASILTGASMPVDRERAFHPTRMILRARKGLA